MKANADMNRPQKVKDARLNTFGVDVPALVSDSRSPETHQLTAWVAFTSDATGETLSISAGGAQFTVPFEAVQRLVDVTRQNRAAQ